MNKASPVYCVQVGIWTPEKNEQAGAELGQAQIKLELGFTLFKI